MHTGWLFWFPNSTDWKNKRGINIFICEKFVSTKTENLSICKDEIQSCEVKVQLNHEFLLIIGIYRPHSGTVLNFIETLESFYEHPDFLKSWPVFIAGDFNINILSENNSNVIIFMSSLQSNFFLPAITKATRFSPCENENILSTSLDNIWINTLNAFTSGILDYDISDHSQTFIIFFTSKPTCCQTEI